MKINENLKETDFIDVPLQWLQMSFYGYFHLICKRENITIMPKQIALCGKRGESKSGGRNVKYIMCSKCSNILNLR